MTQGYTCTCCGLYHDQVTMSFVAPAPIYVHAITDRKELEERVQLTSDTCIIDNENFFIRGSIVIPIVDSEEEFSWGVWVTVSEANFENMYNLWEHPNREDVIEPAFGYLSTPIPFYEETLNLHVLSHTMPVGFVPIIEIEPTERQLSIDQRNGITMEQVHEISRMILKQ